MPDPQPPYRLTMSPSSPLQERETPLSRERLKDLVHYICDRIPNPNKWGSVKMNKALFYTDREAYVRLGEPVTGETYVKQRMGPVSSHLNEIVDELVREGRIAVRRVQKLGAYGKPYEHHLYFATADPKVDDFSGPQVAIVNQVVDTIAHRHTAASISDASHDMVYEMAEPGEIIPYYTAFSHLLVQPTESAMAWAAESLAGGGFAEGSA